MGSLKIECEEAKKLKDTESTKNLYLNLAVLHNLLTYDNCPDNELILLQIDEKNCTKIVG